MVTDGAADDTGLRLRPPALGDEAVSKQAHRELEREGHTFLLNLDPGMAWGDYVRRLDEERQGLSIPAGWVSSTFLLAETEREVVGRVSIRHELTTFLREIGGHIGYSVRPQFRRRGYATEIFRQSLQVASGLGIDPALVTCDDDNPASARVIERGGGVLAGIVPGDYGTAGKRRYWVPTEVTKVQEL